MNILGIPDIYRALSQIGLTKSHVRKLLPDWWDDSIASSDTGRWEFVTLLARRLSLDANCLAAGNIQPIGSVSNIAYKHRMTLDDEPYRPGSMIAAALAEAVVAAMRKDFSLQQFEPLAIRETLLQLNNGIVDLDGLMIFCWSHGIPVIPLPNFPIGIRKMDGAIFKINDRPAIIISRKNESKAWLSFILAHELGHYCLGHLTNDSSIIDVDLKTETTTQSDGARDQQEVQADDFALKLLGGDQSDSITKSWSPRLSAVAIAVSAKNEAMNAGASAGHLVLRYAFITKRWVESLTALKFLEEDFEAQSALQAQLADSIDLKEIAEDLRSLIVSITGIPYLD